METKKSIVSEHNYNIEGGGILHFSVFAITYLIFKLLYQSILLFLKKLEFFRWLETFPIQLQEGDVSILFTNGCSQGFLSVKLWNTFKSC